MTNPVRMDFRIQRNEGYGPRRLILTDTTGAPLDLTNVELELSVDSGVGRTGEPQLSVYDLINSNGSYVQVIDGPTGEIEIVIAEADISALAGPDDGDVALVHNLMMQGTDGKRHCVARGFFVAEAGV